MNLDLRRLLCLGCGQWVTRLVPMWVPLVAVCDSPLCRCELNIGAFNEKAVIAGEALGVAPGVYAT